MSPELEEALALWEAGELSRDELARRFPDENIAGLLDAFDRMSAAAVAPIPDASGAWEAVHARLPVRLADRRRGQGKAIRLLAAAMIAVLVLGATAYAVVPSVRRAMNDAAGVITGAPDRSSTPTRLGDGSGTDQLNPDISSDDATPGSDGGAPVEEDTEAGTDDGSNSGSNDDESDSGSGADDGSTGDEGSDDASGGGSSGSEEEDAADGENASSGSDEPDS